MGSLVRRYAPTSPPFRRWSAGVGKTVTAVRRSRVPPGRRGPGTLPALQSVELSSGGGPEEHRIPETSITGRAAWGLLPEKWAPRPHRRGNAVHQPPEAVARHRHLLREDRHHLPGRTSHRGRTWMVLDPETHGEWDVRSRQALWRRAACGRGGNSNVARMEDHGHCAGGGRSCVDTADLASGRSRCRTTGRGHGPGRCRYRRPGVGLTAKPALYWAHGQSHPDRGSQPRRHHRNPAARRPWTWVGDS
ncbi:hypothetical protein SROCM77S_06783 [Streptomyces rochei]